MVAVNQKSEPNSQMSQQAPLQVLMLCPQGLSALPADPQRGRDIGGSVVQKQGER